MPLPVPKLDSRTWAELTAEAVELVPRHAAGWTDHNLHDPGITLIELFAWLSEQLLFRVDRVTPAMMRAILRLVGVRPRPTGVASTAVAFRPPAGAGAGAPTPVAAHTQITDRNGRVVFETTAGVTVAPVWLGLGPGDAAAGSIVTSSVTSSGPELVVRTALNGSGRAFEPFGASPAVGDALLLGFDRAPVPADGALSLYVWTPTWATDASTAADIAEERRRADADCAPTPARVWPTKAACEHAVPDPTPAPPAATAPLPHYWATPAWEYWTGDAWTGFDSVVDHTRALTLAGSVRLAGAPAQVAGPHGGQFWLRCRLAGGGYDCPPSLLAIAVNAVPAVHAATTTAPEDLGTSRGLPGEEYELAQRPVVPGSLRVRLVRADGSLADPWTVVTEWDESGPGSRHVLTDHARGRITFGDGRQGAVPAAGAAIAAVTYQVGGDVDGNVPDGTLVELVAKTAGSPDVHQPFPAIGGAPAESLGRAHGRALDLLADAARGVTTADLEQIARRTPGVPIARATAIPGHHPDSPCLPAPGVVTVVVLPPCGSPPRPSPELRREVRRYLERRRPVATELHVVGPDYVPVTVSAELHVALGAAAGVATAGQAAMDAFFDPLTGGPTGDGWPFGRDVLEAEVMAVLQALPGVSYVDAVAITVGGGGPQCGNASLCGVQLVESRPHQIVVIEDDREDQA